MAIKSNISEGRIAEAKENMLNDVSKAFDGGFYNDVNFVLSDNVSVSTNKFMLACRVPYFSSMLFGGFAADTSVGNSVPLTCCDSLVFKQILNFVFKGECYISDMNILSLLNLLEASRYFCLEILKDGITDYLQCLIDDEKLVFEDCLIAFEFTTINKFTRASEYLLNFIDKNLAAISSVPEFRNMSESCLKMVLEGEEKASAEIDRFTAFAKWLELNDEESLTVDFKSEMLRLFELSSFDSKELVEVVMKTNLFDLSEISKVLGERLIKLEEKVERQKRSILITHREELSLKNRHIFAIPARFADRSFCCVEFFLSYTFDCNDNFEDYCEDNCGYLYSYDVECSMDRENWTQIVTCAKKKCGRQNFDFQPSRMKYIAVTLKEGIHCESEEIDVNPVLENLSIYEKED